MDFQITSEDPRVDFARFYQEHREAIVKHCYYRCGDRELAKELAQETFMRTWKYIRKGKEVENMQAFLYRTATNLLINALKKRGRQTHVSLETLVEEGVEFEDKASPEAQMITAQTIAKVIHELDEKQQELVRMRYIQGLPPKEIAKQMNVSPNTISIRLTRALKQLRPFIKS